MSRAVQNIAFSSIALLVLPLHAACMHAHRAAPARQARPAPATDAAPLAEPAPAERVERDSSPAPTGPLEELAHAHRTPSTRPVPIDGAIEIPADWKSLPQTALLWRRPEPYPHRLVLLDDAVLSLEGRHLVVREPRTGAARWRAPAGSGPAGSADPWFAGGCGVAVVYTADAITARSLDDGSVRWAVAAPTRFAPVVRDVDACAAAIRIDTPGTSPVLRIFDVRDGRRLAQHGCNGSCIVLAITAEAAILDEGSTLLRVPLDGGEPVATSVHPCESRGEPRWSRITAERCTRLSVRGLEIVDRTSGERRGAAVPAESGLSIAAVSATHLLLVAATAPVLLDLDPRSGSLRSMRVLPDRGDLVLRGDVALITWYHGTAAIDLAMESPPIRTLQTIDDDVDRSLSAISAAPRRHVPSGPSWEYPQSPGDAIAWIERLMPLVGDRLAAQVTELSPSQAAALLPVLGRHRSDSVDAAVIALLERSFAPAPTPETIALRAAAARAICIPMREDVADRLAAATLRWIDRAGRTIGAPCEGLSCALLDAIEASRDALDRASPRAGPSERVHARLARLAPRTPLGCTPDEEDLAISAAVRTLVSLEVGVSDVAVSSSSCLDVEGIAGRVRARTDERSGAMGGGRWSVHPAREPIALATGDARWDTARQRTFTWRYECGPLCASRGRIVVALVDGRWRTIELRHELDS